VAVVLAMLSASCASTGASNAAGRGPRRALVVLVPDSDGSVGRATVSNSHGSVELTAAGDSVLATAKAAPGPVKTLSEDELTRIFDQAISALPPAPKHFTLFFEFESDELTSESRALVPEIQQTVTARPLPDIIIVGHTDTMGTSRANYDLGLKRATVVRNLLTSVGLDGSTITATSLGELDLLVKTPDETPEPRNRRVEIAVR
jgi:outer membrane protein OmpA-like peptidoglycan-associated protein